MNQRHPQSRHTTYSFCGESGFFGESSLFRMNYSTLKGVCYTQRQRGEPRPKVTKRGGEGAGEGLFIASLSQHHFVAHKTRPRPGHDSRTVLTVPLCDVRAVSLLSLRSHGHRGSHGLTDSHSPPDRRRSSGERGQRRLRAAALFALSF